MQKQEESPMSDHAAAAAPAPAENPKQAETVTTPKGIVRFKRVSDDCENVHPQGRVGTLIPPPELQSIGG